MITDIQFGKPLSNWFFPTSFSVVCPNNYLNHGCDGRVPMTVFARESRGGIGFFHHPEVYGPPHDKVDDNCRCQRCGVNFGPTKADWEMLRDRAMAFVKAEALENVAVGA